MITVELVTAVVGLLIGAWVKVKQQNDITMRLAMQRDQMEIDDRQDARKWSSKLPNVQWTKRTLALILVSTWCAMHLGVSVPELLGLKSSVTVGYTEIIPKFLFFGEKEAFKWIEVEGSAVTPAFNQAVMLILGYYYGSGGSRR